MKIPVGNIDDKGIEMLDFGMVDQFVFFSHKAPLLRRNKSVVTVLTLYILCIKIARLS